MEPPEREVWGVLLIDPLYTRLSMARRKSKMFKQISNVHLETVADNDWSSFLKLEKQDPSMRSAYIDKIRISYVLDSEESTGENTGIMFVASHDNALDSSTPANNDGNIIAATARHGYAGTISLDVKRRITVDYDGASSDTLTLLQGMTGAPIYLHAHKATTGSSENWYLVIETYGRWFSQTSL